MSQSISESQFYMWRTLFALAHADNVVTAEELRFMVEILEDFPFSPEQAETLKEDIKTPQDTVAMYKQISDAQDRMEFFRFAQDMVWVDGDFGAEEQAIMLELQKLQVQATDVEDLVGKVNLRLEDTPGFDAPDRRGKKDTKKIVHSFRELFLRERYGKR